MIKNNIKVKLLSFIEREAIINLIAKGYLELVLSNQKYTFNNVQLTEKGANEIKNISIIEFDEELLRLMFENWRGEKCSINLLNEKLGVFFAKTSLQNITDQEVLDALTSYQIEKDIKYIGKIEYFPFKYDQYKNYSSRLEQEIIKNREMYESNSNYIKTMI